MNVVDLSYKLKRVLWSNDALSLLPGCGWNDGGCRSLMRAFRIWLGPDNVRTYQIVKKPEQLHSEHVFIRIGDRFLDGDGVSGSYQMEYRWRFEERLPVVIIREFDPETEPDHVNGEKPFYIGDSHINQLVKLLDHHFNKEEILECLL